MRREMNEDPYAEMLNADLNKIGVVEADGQNTVMYADQVQKAGDEYNTIGMTEKKPYERFPASLDPSTMVSRQDHM